MTEPTDAELDAVLCSQWPAFSMQATLVRMWVRAAMRDALAKWGTPPAGAGEPCGWAVFRPDGSMVHGSSEDSAEACLFALSESEVACGQKPGYMAANNGWKPQPIYTTPQPTQSQAGAVPLTDEQMDSALGSAKKVRAGYVGWVTDQRREWGRAVERAHGIGIKGGQHGNE